MKNGASSTDVCVVGGGPAGVVLAYLLARKGVQVTLLEGAGDFRREFRGDTLQPAVLEVMQQLGLTEALHRLDHIKAPVFRSHTEEGVLDLYDLRELRTPFPYIMLVHQPTFLAFIVEQARRYPTFTLAMGCRVEELIKEEGIVRGVRYRHDGRLHELRATLTVGADGRFSKMRQLAEAQIVRLSPGQDVLWFRLPRHPDDPKGAEIDIYSGERNYTALLERDDHWQVGYSIAKGQFGAVKAAGLEPIRSFVRRWVPWLADRVDFLQDWKQITLLSVEILRVKRWSRPGLLLIGDAAHVISPSGGLGINVAVQDAVATADLLTLPLLNNRLSARHLARVQRRRAWQVVIVQAFQVALERANARNFERGLGSRQATAFKVLRRVPILRTLPGWITAYGVRPERLSQRWLKLPDAPVSPVPKQLAAASNVL